MSIFTYFFIIMKNYLFAVAFIVFCIAAYGQQAGDFRTRSGGVWTDISATTPWEMYDGANWIVATSTPTSASDVTIGNGHAITVSVSLQPCNNLLVENGGKLYAGTSSSTERYVNIYGNIVCNGTIGNGVISDGLGFNIMNNTTITGNGVLDCNRIKQGNNQTCYLTISRDINLRYGGTCLYNDDAHNGSVFNVVIENGVSVNIIGSGTTPGSLSVDGPSGATSGNSCGSILIKGNVFVSGTTYLRTNNANASFPVSVTIDGTGKLETGGISCAASGSAGHTFTINTGGILKITGDNTSAFVQPNPTNNTYNFSPGSTIEYSGSTNQYVYDFRVNYQHIKISGSGIKSLQASATINQSLEVAGTASFYTNNYSCTLKSTALQTASVKNITSTASPAIMGAVTVERYIPARRAWRLLAAPLSSASVPSIYNSWQEAGASGGSLPGYGTWITSAGIASPGFDAASTTSSLRYYDAATDAFITPPNTNTTKLTDNAGAYMVFIRGDRTQTGSGTANTTTLRMTGTLNQGTMICGSNIAGTQFTVVPNPYPSPVDFEAIYSSNNNLTSFYVWDAQNGTYGMYRLVTRTGAGSYVCVPSTPSDDDMRFIQSGQAFFILGDAAGGASTVTFTENMKANGTPPINVFKTTNASPQRLSVNLEKQTATANLLNDGIAILFDSSYTAAYSNEDIKKLANFNENLSILNDTTDLALERRPSPLSTDTIQLHLLSTTSGNYQFTIVPDNIVSFDTIYLKDNYLNTMTALSATAVSSYNFSVSSTAGTYDPFRFSLILKKGSPLPLSKLLLHGMLKGQAAELQWEAPNETGVQQYEIERSDDMDKTFVRLGIITPKTDANGSYTFLDRDMRTGINYYRIKSIGANGSELFSNSIRLSYTNKDGRSGITIFPNPVQGGKMHINFGQMETGTYQVIIHTISGMLMNRTFVTHASQDAIHTLSFGKTFAVGTYIVDVKNEATGISYSQIIQIE